MALYFAYGSNMSRALMRPRCPAAREVGCAELPGYRFVVTADGYASIVQAPGARVHGLLWRLGVRDLASLHAYENVAGGLYRIETVAVRVGARRLPALVYIARSRARGRPRPGYLALVLAAAQEIRLPSAYRRSLARLAPSGRPRGAPDAEEAA